METSISEPAAAALPKTTRGPADWQERARTVTKRYRYWCTDTDTNCHHTRPHHHGVACDYTCNCKGQ